MKNILITLLLLLSIGCSSQNPIINITDKNGKDELDGSYYKDIDNHLNQFEGTWLYENGSTLLKIIFIKKTMAFNGRFYEDLLIGEYQYIENGVEKINTLSNINSAYDNQHQHSIDGNSLIKKTTRPICNDCSAEEKRVRMVFYDSVRDMAGSLIVKKSIVGTQEAIKIKLRSSGPGASAENNPPQYLDTSVPSGEYTLLKQ